MLIGLSGVGGAGKDAVARVLVEEHGFKQFALATKMKESVLALDPYVGVRHCEPYRLSQLIDAVGAEEAKKWPEVRRLYQRMGTEVGRKTIDEKLWITKLFELVKDSRATDIVISDVRFLNEAQYIGKRGVVWRIIRPGAGLEGEAAKHISELELSDDTDGIFDYVLENDGTLKDLSAKVADALTLCSEGC